MSNEMIYRPVMTCNESEYIGKFEEAIRANEKHLDSIEEKAIASGNLLYRFITEGVADGKAIYQIIRVNKNTVRVRLCQIDPMYCDYVVPYWGAEATISKEYAEKSINAQDTLRKLFARK